MSVNAEDNIECWSLTALDCRLPVFHIHPNYNDYGPLVRTSASEYIVSFSSDRYYFVDINIVIFV